MTGKKLTEEEVQESLRFANGAMAAAGLGPPDPESEADILAALRDEITFDEAAARAIRRALA
jgi:hypothetical protein